MSKKDKIKNPYQKRDPIQTETEYVAFLKRRLDSDNYKANSTPEEIAITKKKYDKAKLKLKFLKDKI